MFSLNGFIVIFAKDWEQKRINFVNNCVDIHSQAIWGGWTCHTHLRTTGREKRNGNITDNVQVRDELDQTTTQLKRM